VPRYQRCEEAQDYLYAEPLSAAEFEAYLSATRLPSAPTVLSRSMAGRTAAAASRHWGGGDFPARDDQRRAIGLSLLLLLTWRTPPCLVVILCAAGGAAFPIV